MSKILCIYHGGCDDGFAAAWCVRHALGDDAVEFYPGVYQQEPPDVRDRNVLFVDFSYKRPVLNAMQQSAASILILDHHKTAHEDLADLLVPTTWSDWCESVSVAVKQVRLPIHPMAALFDVQRSGAGIAWDFFHPGQSRPEFIDYIEDRDLWKKQKPNGDLFTIALRSYPQTFEQWDSLFMKTPGVSELIGEGWAIQRYYRARIDEMKKSAYLSRFGILDSDPPFARVDDPYGAFINAPYFAASELAGEIPDLFGEAQYGASYFEVRQGQWQYSLRSRGDFDVSAIARRFGGGGHKNAAGFTVPAPVHVR